MIRMPIVSRVLRPSKYELYVSIPIVLVGFCYYYGHRPVGFYDIMIFTGASITGLVCVLNALMDSPRMNAVERVMAGVWLCIVAYCVVIGVADVLTTKTFSPR